jgi:type IV pilus assembly protein PilV
VTTPTRQRGITLIEILVAVLVLSVGLLGLAGLQTSALRNNHSSFERSLAVMESYSIIDAMRADREGAENGDFNIGLEDEPTGASFAANELTKWRNRLIAQLGPDATGSVNCNGLLCSIVVQWNDARGTRSVANPDIPDDSTQHQVLSEVQL